MRLFFAVYPPLRLAEALYEKWTGLQDSGAALRRVPLENYHITLLFLGRTEPSRLLQVREAAESIAGTTAAFDIVLGGLKCYGSIENPQVLVETISSGRMALSELHSGLSKALEMPPEKREFDPHITVARISRRRNRGPAAIPLFPQNPGETEAKFQARELALVQSELKPEGARYSIMDRWNFMEGV